MRFCMWSEFIIVGVLALWFVASLAYQFAPLRAARWVRRWDVACMLPSYHFFSSVPRDLQLYYRDRLSSGAITRWHEIPLQSPTLWWRGLWNPPYLIPYVYWALVENIARLAGQDKATQHRPLEQTFVYDGLCRAIRHLPHGRSTVDWQFKIEEGNGCLSTCTPRVILTSGFNPL